MKKVIHQSRPKSLALNASDQQESYLLCRLVLGPQQHILISFDQYKELLNSREILFDLLSFEEKFFAICEHFREVEEFVFRTTLGHVLYSRMKAQNLHSTGAQFGRLTAALLSSVRLYLDSVLSHAKALSNGTLDATTVKAVGAKEYDTSFCYRVMEAIRNHAQHRAFPVQSTTFREKWEEVQDTLNYTVDFYFDVTKIDDEKFKSTTKVEILASGEPVNLRSCVRSYFASVCTMHEEYRKMFKVHKEKAEANIVYWQEVWTKQFSEEKLLAVAACKFKGNYIDKEAEKAYIDPQLDEYRLSIVAKTRSLANMSKRRAVIY